MDGMHLELSMEQIERIAGFLGYGNPAESVWFVGIEEGLGKATSNDAVENLKQRGSFKEVMDLRDAHHQRLLEGGKLIDFDAKPPSTQVWQWIAKIMCASSAGDWRKYINSSLGRSGGDTFLTELSPIPSNSTANKTWMTAFAALDGDLTERLHRRKRKLLQLLEEKAPRLIICYGHGRAREYEAFFGLNWNSITSRIAIDRQRACPVLLLPFFGLGHMSQTVIEEMRKLDLLPVQATKSYGKGSLNRGGTSSSANPANQLFRKSKSGSKPTPCPSP